MNINRSIVIYADGSAEAISIANDALRTIEAATIAFTTRAAMVAALPDIEDIEAGRVIYADGLAYERAPGDISIPDMSGWKLVGPITAEGYGGLSQARSAADTSKAVVLDDDLARGYLDTVAQSVYGGGAQSAAILQRVQVGSAGRGETPPQPVVRVEKYTTAAIPIPGATTNYDRAFEVSLHRAGGGGRSVAATHNVRVTGSALEAIGTHSRVALSSGSTGTSAFAGWDYVAAYGGSDPRSLVGRELNVTNAVADHGWQARPSASVGREVGIILNPDDPSGTTLFPNTAGIWLERNTVDEARTDLGSWHTGIIFGLNSITPTDGNGNNEAIRIRGGAGAGNRHGGVAFGDDNDPGRSMTYGLKSLRMSFADEALVWARPGHRVIWGESAGSAPYITIDSSNRLVMGGMTGADRGVWPVIKTKDAAPFLPSNGLLAISTPDDSTVRFHFRGSDGVTRTADVGLT